MLCFFYYKQYGASPRGEGRSPYERQTKRLKLHYREGGLIIRVD